MGLVFLAEFFEISRRRRPANVDALAELGAVYTRLGRFSEGLEVDRALTNLAPDNPTVRYNLACSLSLCGHAAEALDELERAVALGYRDGEHLARDEDLAALRAQPRFRELLAKLSS
jgi:Flp pilus assembly protein TadD